MKKGDPLHALTEPNTVVITEETAQKYFGLENPLGNILRFENKADLLVTGVVENVPNNSHFQFDFLASFSSLRELVSENMRLSWYWNPCWTYILLKEGASPDSLVTKLHDFSQKYFPPSFKDDQIIKLQPLTKIHLHSHLDLEIVPNSDVSYVYIFSIAAVFILLIACINYVNLTTARSTNRSKEVGIRKTLGASRGQLMKQFLGEFILFSIIASILSILLVWIFLPAFRSFSGKELSLNILHNWEIIAGFFFFTIFIGVVSGIYPAFFLSNFMPVRVLKEKMPSGTKSSSLRKILAVAQFTISVILIIGTGITFKQLNFMRNKELGFLREQVVMIKAHRSGISSFYDGFKNQLLQNSQVRNVTGMDEILGANFQTASLLPEGSTGNKAYVVPQLTVFHDFTETFGIEIIAGRDFSIKFPSDLTEGIIINEAAAGQFGWTPEEAVGKRLTWAESIQVRIVGVVKNFNYTSLEQSITPFILTMPRSEGHMNRVMKYIAVKVMPGDIQRTLAFLRSKWENAIPNRSFEYFFLDDKLNTLYTAQEKMGEVFIVVFFLTIFIACLGIFALASFTAEVRTKEIGIRKILGASSGSIVFLLSKEFIRWVLVANLVGWPIVYFIMYRWLQNFAYQTNIALGIFLSSAGLTLVFALVAVSYQSIKASVSDPINSLRQE